MRYMDKQKMRIFINKCLKELRKKHQILLDVCVSERCITHKLAEIIAKKIGNQWDIDCEYNRDRHDPKILCLRKRNDIDEFDEYSVYPDIIVHKRLTNANYFIIEVKKSCNNKDREWDIKKLIGYREQLGYIHCVFINISCDDEIDTVLVNDECV